MAAPERIGLTGVGEALARSSRIFLTSSGSQAVFGSLPLVKYSMRLGQPEQVRLPVTVQILTLIRVLGTAKAVL